MSRLHWIEMPGRLAIMARPRAGDWPEMDVAGWKTSGVDLIVSLLECEEVSELALQREAELCRASGIEFVSFPISDRGVPDLLPTSALAVPSPMVSPKVVRSRFTAGRGSADHRLSLHVL